MIDQTLLPEEYKVLEIDSIDVLAEAIVSLRVRGAPAIGIAGAMGAALAAVLYTGDSREEMDDFVLAHIKTLAGTRPTAVNLFWALDRMKALLEKNDKASVAEMRDILIQEAEAILEEDKAICRQMGRNGQELIPDGATVLTHCNAGGLATGDYGTAVGVFYAAQEAGKTIKVFADETRPLLQGARLTSWELQQSDIDVTVLCDSAAATLMQKGVIDCVVVGSDRVAANGDAANKIGTYSLAVLANAHNIPFYIVAPVSTFDFDLASGDLIPIEQRAGEEVSEGFGKKTVPDGVNIYNPAFDVTPHTLITAIVTEKGVIEAPNTEKVATLLAD